MSNLVFPVYEFRPFPGLDWLRGGAIHRYAHGAWLPDDGKYDLAFAVHAPGAGMWLGLCLPYYGNILWSWTTGHWSGYEANHPRGNAWHYMLRDGARDWGRPWARDKHPNEVANESARKWSIQGRSCSNGSYVDMKTDDKHIAAGLVRNRATGEVLRPPSELVCMYCHGASAPPTPERMME